ncbi:sphingosine hydroxylase [Dichotomocladium elegans]|nr:sphingosine hydroxylase [Dichotomocladium elegans]
MDTIVLKVCRLLNLDTFFNDPWSDTAMSMWVPILAYWVYSLLFQYIMTAKFAFFEKYRIHTAEEMRKRNRVTLSRVLVMVAFQQAIQFIVGMAFLKPVADPVKLQLEQEMFTAHLASQIFKYLSPYTTLARYADQIAWSLYNIGWPCLQLFLGMVIMDTHQYFLHRLFHVNTFLYKHFHSHHHRLYVTYAFGALYNHPLEGFLLDTVGATIAYELTGMSPRLGMIFFTFSNMKTVDDHCGYSFPWDPLQVLFGNNVVYHDIHHQPYGIKTNFSQPYFTFWDNILGTRYIKNKDAKKKE